jgi:hypothetical protein
VADPKRVSRDQQDRRDEARRWVRRKRIFYTVVGIYLSLSLMWLAIDLLDDSSGYWFYWPMLGTGLGVLMTGVVLGASAVSSGRTGRDARSTSTSATRAIRGTGPMLGLDDGRDRWTFETGRTPA